MNVLQVYNRVAELGDETTLESASSFYAALNTALLQVSAVRPQTRTAEFCHEPIDNMLTVCDQIGITGECAFEADKGKSYSFETNANGLAYIETLSSGTWSTLKLITLTTTGSKIIRYKGFILNDNNQYVTTPVRIRIDSSYVYTVRNICIFSNIFSASENDIPDGSNFTRYDVSAVVNDFLGLCSPAMDANTLEYIGDDYRVENGRILCLPNDKPGIFKVTYKHKPTAITATDAPEADETAIDLDEEIAELLYLKVASYIWLIDEPSLASQYESMYQQRASEIYAQTRNQDPCKYKRNGW